MKWTEEEISSAIELLKNRNTYLEIGVKLNRTPISVRNKLNEFNLKSTMFIEDVKHCICCNEKLINMRNIFCDSSCAATYNNKIRVKKIKNVIINNEKINKRKRNNYHLKKNKNCLFCDKITTNIYCDAKCQNNDRFKNISIKIESGDTTLYFKQYKKYLIEKHGNKCMECGWCEINSVTGNVPIQLEHIDGNSDNNSLDNLKLLCPNCHSLTSTYGNLNKGNGRDSKRNIKRNIWRNNL